MGELNQVFEGDLFPWCAYPLAIAYEIEAQNGRKLVWYFLCAYFVRLLLLLLSKVESSDLGNGG